MRSLIVSSLVSLDGIHGDPQSWVGDYFDQQAAEQSLAVLHDSDAMLMGRNTYDYFAPRWSSPSGPYLERISQMRKYVFSSTLTAAHWNNTTIIPGDPVAAVRELKQQGDRHLVIYGYGQLAQTLLEHGLVDKLNFVVNPVMHPGAIDVGDVESGGRTSWREFHAPDPAGVMQMGPYIVSRDGNAWGYSYRRLLDDLYAVDGLR